MNTMGWITSLQTTPQLQALGWALLQFLWQGTVIAAVCSCALLCFRRQARARYAIGSAGMLLMLMTFLATLAVSWKAPQFAQRATADLPWNAVAAGMQSWSSALLQSTLGNWVSNSTMQLGLAWITVLWVLGVLLFQVRLLVQWRCVDRLRRAAMAATDPHLTELVHELTGRLKIRRSIRVLETAALQVPAVVGWFDPIVLVPAGILAHLTTEQLRAVLAHELAHLRRYDHLVNLVQCLTESLLFFHPAVWWLSNQVREDREYCCDDVAVAICGDVLSYARTLQGLEEIRAGERELRSGFGAQQAILAATGGNLMDRITRLFGVQPASQRSMGRWAVPGVMVVLLATAILAASCEPNLVEAPDSAADSGQVEKSVPATEDQGIVELHGDHAIAQLERAVRELEKARQENAITEAEYQDVLKRFKEAHAGAQNGQDVGVPMQNGGTFILNGNDNLFIEDVPMTKEALQEFLSQEGAIHEIDGATLHWVGEDGGQVDLEFGEDRLHRKAKFFAEESVEGAKAKPAAQQTP